MPNGIIGQPLSTLVLALELPHDCRLEEERTEQESHLDLLDLLYCGNKVVDGSKASQPEPDIITELTVQVRDVCGLNSVEA